MAGSINMKTTTLTKITLISLYLAVGLVRVPAQAQTPTPPPQTPSSVPSATPNQPAGSPTNTAPQPPPSTPSSTPSQPAGLPTVTAPQPPTVVPSSTSNTPQSAPNPDATSTATASNVKVSCQDLTTVVQKGERQALMFNWRTKHFGGEYTPENRCQLVSSRLQSAADRNGGTLKGLQLGSGVVNGQTVICVFKTGENSCNNGNLLFTLKPENAKRPQAVIAKISTFAKSGTMTVNESASDSSQLDLDLGNWERQAFVKARKSPTPRQEIDRGF